MYIQQNVGLVSTAWKFTVCLFLILELFIFFLKPTIVIFYLN